MTETINRWVKASTAVGVAVVVALLVAGCGSSDDNGSTNAASAGASTGSASKADPAVAKLVPAAIKSKGTIKVATDPTYPPAEFIAKDGKTINGIDIDLVNAIAAKMGVKADVVRSTFDAIIPGLAAKKYDMAAAFHNDTKERQKVVDFVDYVRAGSAMYVKASGGPAITTLNDLCGKKVAVLKGSTQQDDATTQSKKCVAAGKPAVTALVFPDQNAANLAISSGRAAVSLADTPVAAYIVKQAGGQFKLSGDQYAVALHGMAFPKGSQLTPAVLAGLKAIIADGTYKSILSKWGAQNIALNTPIKNGATE
jgi:polar amino acid transport system substrate-binding protein